jgi:GNAT superfamily N-acetyltransferase
MKICPNRERLRVERLNQDDLGAFISMVLELYREDPTGRRMSVRKIQRTVSELDSHPDKGAVLVFRSGQEIIGYAIVIHFWSNEHGGNIACIDEMYISPAWRGKGVGSLCLEKIARTEKMKFKGMVVETTRANQGAMTFYAKQGFLPSKNRHWLRKL